MLVPEDGYVTTAPVKSFQPHGHWLWNTAGNVWEVRRQLRPGTHAARAAVRQCT
ncbi:formylglycine-generating enzyme family protein [Streptomyces sp. NBC_01808]|uniref:hypothetical protein n=1 Tax=Streptomyces sp. NBC_01808 TaxID=2975947 RepID=UPI002DD97239|nr:hypothetical protein [Streptomyces sp. NBC_01808]WSA35943.1 formylglycine-generating enzyme family protein [Streptomyces sp. NBC_01808]